MMKKSEFIEYALALVDARNQMTADLAIGGEQALIALAVVLIGAGYDMNHMCDLARSLMGNDFALKMQEILVAGHDDPPRPWEHAGSEFYLVQT
jgi:hypothetical protein